MEIQKNNAVLFEKKDNATPSKKKLAAEFGITVEELRQMATGPEIGDENEENCTAAAGMMRGSRKRDGKLTETIQAVQYTGPEAVNRERIEEERIALEEMKSKHVQRQHHHEQHDNYQVIEGGRESIMEDTYTI